MPVLQLPEYEMSELFARMLVYVVAILLVDPEVFLSGRRLER